jgi:ATP-binding cassette subfamily B protein
MSAFPFYKQRDEKDCGPACLKMILKYYNKYVDLDVLAQLSETKRTGTTLLGLSNAAERLGLKSTGARVNFEALKQKVQLPAIVFWEQKHFVVVHKIYDQKVFIADPAHGHITYQRDDFLKNWSGENNQDTGVVLMLEPTSDFASDIHDTKDKKISFTFIWGHLRKHKLLLRQLLYSLLAGCILQFSLPFLAQSLVDSGIQNQNLNFVYLVLLAQLMLFIGKASLEVIRTYILIHIGARLQISLISEFFIKLMRLPVSFFESKVTGDLIQRINDHKKVEGFLTVTSLSGLFSIVNLIVFGGILLYYSLPIFLVFVGGSALFLGWIIIFQKKKREFDYRLFSLLSEEQNKVLEIIQGMQEIKLHNAEREKRWSWENIQAKIFRSELQTLTVDQSQSVGASMINELKNIVITILAAKFVIDGHITLGMMLSISYIIGQLNSPLNQIVEFFSIGQKAKISIERLLEIHNKCEEPGQEGVSVDELNLDRDICINNLSYAYSSERQVLKELNFLIPANKVTAIVGPSGSGKTTLLKLLLKINEPTEGNISIGNVKLKNVPLVYWRDKCGTVMQEGFIFNDTIANNVALGQGHVDQKRLYTSLKIANIEEFIDDLPLGVNTMLGSEGLDVSVGQKQRILIARAVYRNPKIILFDEATSALDANNEKMVMSNLKSFFANRTVVTIAHRLSTVIDADQIVVLDKGRIVETGNHESLIRAKGYYFNLIKNQLQLEPVS